MTQVVADREPAHHRRTGAGQNGSANRCRRSEFEWMSDGRRLMVILEFVGAQ
jgi:hypothetical protein